MTVLGSEGDFQDEVANYHISNAFLNAIDPLARAEVIGADTSRPANTCSLKKACRQAARKAETEAIMEALSHTRWNRIRAAALLETSYKNLLKKIKEYGIGQA